MMPRNRWWCSLAGISLVLIFSGCFPDPSEESDAPDFETGTATDTTDTPPDGTVETGVDGADAGGDARVADAGDTATPDGGDDARGDTVADTAGDAGADTTADTGDTSGDGCTRQTWYRDGDTDGYGTDSTTTMACTKPTGYVAQKGDCNDSEMSAYPGGTEVCDGINNDCDGSTDENLTQNCSKQMGVCSGATVDCQNGSYPTCGAAQYGSEYESSESTCDSLDNDCDGMTNEMVTRSCGNGSGACANCKGVCSSASETCDSSGSWSCSAPSDYESTESSCDGLDNDCDGKTDEKLTQACPEQDGVCSGSSTTCQNGAFNCTASDYGSNYESTESSCDTLDNDCDGNTDEQLFQKCANQKGVCKGSTTACQNGQYPSCTASDYGTNYESTESSCDDLDNDCNGTTDRGIGCTFNTTISGNPSAAINDIAIHPNTGAVYVAGSIGDVFKQLSNKSSEDIFVAKYNSAGIQKWMNTVTSPGIDSGNAVAIDTGNNRVHVGGIARGSIAGQSVSGPTDGVVLSYDFSGTRQNAHLVSTSGGESVTALDVDPSGSSNRVLVAGVTNDSFPGETNEGGLDGFVIEYDKSWAPQWNVQEGSTKEDQFLSISVNPSTGTFAVAGATKGVVPMGGTNRGGFDLLMAKYNSSGNRQWVRQAGTSSRDVFNSVDLNPATGATYFSGTMSGTLRGTSTVGGADALLMKRGSAGTFQWLETVGSSNYDVYAAVDYDTDSGTIYTAGNSEGAPASTSNNGEVDAMAASYTSSGSRNWVELRGTSEQDAAYAVGADPGSSDLYIGGTWSWNSSTQSGSAFLAQIR